MMLSAFLFIAFIDLKCTVAMFIFLTAAARAGIIASYFWHDLSMAMLIFFSTATGAFSITRRISPGF
jgi:hypothetical protein